MNVEINLLGVLGATVLAMAIGGLWYSKAMFGKTWMELAKINEKDAKDGAMKAMVGMLILSLVMSYVLAHVAYLSDSFFTDYSYQTAAIMSGIWMWIGFALPILVSGSLFEQRPWKLTAINAGNWLVTLVGMGIVIGLIGL